MPFLPELCSRKGMALKTGDSGQQFGHSDVFASSHKTPGEASHVLPGVG